jgi:hypothetical protein
MIFFGWGKKNLALGEMPAVNCKRCGDFRPFKAILNYSYFRLYFIFGVVTARKYIAACNVCGQGFLMDKDKVTQLMDKEPIPFLDRWGLGLLVGSVTALALLFTMHH